MHAENGVDKLWITCYHGKSPPLWIPLCSYFGCSTLSNTLVFLLLLNCQSVFNPTYSPLKIPSTTLLLCSPINSNKLRSVCVFWFWVSRSPFCSSSVPSLGTGSSSSNAYFMPSISQKRLVECDGGLSCPSEHIISSVCPLWLQTVFLSMANQCLRSPGGLGFDKKRFLLLNALNNLSSNQL